MATTKSKSSQSKSKSSSTSTTRRTSRRTSAKPTASKTSPSKTSPSKASPSKTSPAAADAGNAKVSLSSPLAQGTQIIATITGLTPGEAVRAHLTGPLAREETLRLRADPSGTTQVFIHGPRAGGHSLSIKAESGHAHAEFEVK